jgi:hypothetical protein
MTGGFNESPLRLNAGLGQLDEWNEEAIKTRAGQLADQALAVWAAPELDNGILATYRPTKVEEKGGYTVINHPNLLASGIRDVFEAFRKEVLALDPCVSHQQAASLDYLAVVRRLARVQDDLRKAIAQPLACDAHHGETEPLAYSREG